MDDATKWIRARGDRPWFLSFAFNLPHVSLHVPPRSLWVTDHSDLDPRADPETNPRAYFKAMVEAMDTEIGRLLAGVATNRASNALVNSADMFTTILDMAGIQRATVPPGAAVDSVSFFPYLSQPDRTPLRQWIYADTFTPGEGVMGGQHAIRSDTFKLYVRAGQEEFFDIAKDISETRNLLGGTLTREQQAGYDSLRRQLTALHASEPKK